ncbi:MAG: hypothetical protein KDD03_10955 [Gelidibacter sp.]|nr:hypothetical protein [Gelidibacter sp.]
MSFNNDPQISRIIESKRRLLLQKDLFELLQWMDDIEHSHSELNAYTIIEKHLVKKSGVALSIEALRRKNTLLMGILCKYELTLKTEIEYGKTDYDIKRSKEHEKQRQLYLDLISDYRVLKLDILKRLCQLRKG